MKAKCLSSSILDYTVGVEYKCELEFNSKSSDIYYIECNNKLEFRKSILNGDLYTVLNLSGVEIATFEIVEE